MAEKKDERERRQLVRVRDNEMKRVFNKRQRRGKSVYACIRNVLKDTYSGKEERNQRLFGVEGIFC